MSARREGAGPHGILIVDKPRGPTSHDVVQRARRLYQTRAVGHAGTLDPLASGVLVLLFGEATKLSGIATAADKRYRTRLSLGRSTESHDADGRTTAEASVRATELDPARLLEALSAERARTWQVPPAVSAIQLHGERAYDLSRRGEPPELEPRAVSVRSLELVARDELSLSFELEVSKGYYVRALARDLATALGVPAHLSELRRLASGLFTLAEAQPWPPEPAQLPPLLPLPAVLPRLLPTLRLSSDGVRRARCGLPLDASHFLDAPAAETESNVEGRAPTLCAWTDERRTPIAIGRRDGELFRVTRGFAAELLDAPEPDSKREL
jgi:tRNA pseudouridine55 synthase